MCSLEVMFFVWGIRSGKSSIQRVVFHKMSPHETLFLEGTNSLDIKYIANNSFVQFQIWDFPGDYDFKGEHTQALCVDKHMPED